MAAEVVVSVVGVGARAPGRGVPGGTPPTVPLIVPLISLIPSFPSSIHSRRGQPLSGL